MRTKPALLALGLGIAAAVLPAVPAHAVCEIEIDGRCYSVCGIAVAPYNTVDRTLDDKLPDAYCPA